MAQTLACARKCRSVMSLMEKMRLKNDVGSQSIEHAAQCFKCTKLFNSRCLPKIFVNRKIDDRHITPAELSAKTAIFVNVENYIVTISFSLVLVRRG